VAAPTPEQLFSLEPDLPDLRGSVLVEMLDGFVDAGAARRLAREHILGTLTSRLVAVFDADLLHDYRARRPVMLFVEDHWESYDGPRLELRLVNDAAGLGFLVLVGPEPDVMWERFASAVVALVDTLGVRLTIGTNAIPMAVPHTRPLGVTAHASKPELISGYQPWVTTVQVPGSAGHLVEHRLATSGHDSMGFAVHVPHYLAQSGYPTASVVLLRAVAQAGGLTVPLDALEAASREAEETITGLLAQSEELTELVRGLEAQYDAFVAGRAANPLANAGPLPTADELGAELERFLAEQSKRRDD
jgi:predicted ATP-grasp superfamily ATP-dependent carboligase